MNLNNMKIRCLKKNRSIDLKQVNVGDTDD